MDTGGNMPESYDLLAAFSDGSIWTRIGLVGMVVTIVITMFKQALRALPDSGAKFLNSGWSKMVMVFLPYVLGVGASFVPGVFEGGVPVGVLVLFGIIAAHFSEKIYQAVAKAMPNLVVSQGSAVRQAASPRQPAAPVFDPEEPDPAMMGGGDASSLPK
jgi:hypothetical protein